MKYNEKMRVNCTFLCVLLGFFPLVLQNTLQNCAVSPSSTRFCAVKILLQARTSNPTRTRRPLWSVFVETEQENAENAKSRARIRRLTLSWHTTRQRSREARQCVVAENNNLKRCFLLMKYLQSLFSRLCYSWLWVCVHGAFGIFLRSLDIARTLSSK